MSFSTHGLENWKRVRRLRNRVYKEKLRDLYDLEYDNSRPDKELKSIPKEQVSRTLKRLKSERPEKKRLRRQKDILIVFLVLLCTWSFVQLLNWLFQYYYS